MIGKPGISLQGRTPVAEMLFLAGNVIGQRALAARRDWSGRTVYVVASAAGLLLFVMIFGGSYAGARTLVDARAFALLWSIPAWAFLIYLFTDIFIAFGQALGDLYLAADMPLLITMPLRMSSIVVAKFVGGVVQNEIYVATFLVPFVLGFFLGTGAPLWAYPVALVGDGGVPRDALRNPRRHHDLRATLHPGEPSERIVVALRCDCADRVLGSELLGNRARRRRPDDPAPAHAAGVAARVHGRAI